MLIDHTASMFVYASEQPLLYGTMRFIGRVTAPIMCFFISEGYHYTHNLKKYFLRMGVFAVISHFAFMYSHHGSFFAIGKESVIATLTMCLLCVHIYNAPGVKTALKFPLIVLISCLCEYCDWGSQAVIFTMCFELARGNRKNQIIAYSISALAYVFPIVLSIVRDSDTPKINLFVLGVFLPSLLLSLYNGEKGGGKYSKWIFYIFYPAHLIILGYIKSRYWS